jgi:hypothetical protein
MVMFIKLGAKHASKDEIELAVFEVLGKFQLTVFDTGLLLAVLGSKLRLVVLSFVHCVGYSSHKQACNQYKHTYLPAELKEKIKNGGINYYL